MLWVLNALSLVVSVMPSIIPRVSWNTFGQINYLHSPMLCFQIYENHVFHNGASYPSSRFYHLPKESRGYIRIELLKAMGISCWLLNCYLLFLTVWENPLEGEVGGKKLCNWCSLQPESANYFCDGECPVRRKCRAPIFTPCSPFQYRSLEVIET